MISFFIALAVHLAILLPLINLPIALDDMYQYDMLARSLKSGNGFRWYSAADMVVLEPYYSRFLDLDAMDFPALGIPTAFRAPGYPFFLAGLYSLTTQTFHVSIARISQAILAALLAPISFFIGRRIRLTSHQALVTAILMGFYPILLFYPLGLASENLYIPLCALSTLLLSWLPEKPGFGRLVLAAMMLGLTMFTRSIFLPYTFFAALWLYCFHPRKHIAGIILFLAAIALCLPWALRNTQLMGRPAFVENSLGYNLFIGYHPEGDGGFVSSIAIQPMHILSDRERDAVCMEAAREFIRQSPGVALARVAARAFKFFGPETREFIFFYSNNLAGVLPAGLLIFIFLILTLPWCLVLFFGLQGLISIRSEPFFWLVLALLSGYALPHLLIISEPRFHLALVPVLLPLAVKGWGQSRMRNFTSTSRADKLGTIVSLGLIVFILIGVILSLKDFLPLLAPAGNTLYLPY